MIRWKSTLAFWQPIFRNVARRGNVGSPPKKKWNSREVAQWRWKKSAGWAHEKVAETSCTQRLVNLNVCSWASGTVCFTIGSFLSKRPWLGNPLKTGHSWGPPLFQLRDDLASGLRGARDGAHLELSSISKQAESVCQGLLRCLKSRGPEPCRPNLVSDTVLDTLRLEDKADGSTKPGGG